MLEVNQENAREYALNKFKQLPALYSQWNIIHAEGIIEILKILTANTKINAEKLFALAWLHDIGKLKSEENHAELSIEILKNDFILDEIDIDCILNHGSSANPKTEEGKIFRYSDGLSLFVKKTINFKFYAESKEGKSFEEIKEGLEKMYEKYRLKYSDSKKIIELLDSLFRKNLA